MTQAGATMPPANVMSLDAPLLITTCLEAGKVKAAAEDSAMGGAGVDNPDDPLQDCPACAEVDGDQLDAGASCCKPDQCVNALHLLSWEVEKFRPAPCPLLLHAGTKISLHRPSVCSDAVCKACHYACAGAAPKDAPRFGGTTEYYLAGAAVRVQQDYASNKLTSKAQQAAAAAQAAAAESGPLGMPDCATSLQANRLSAAARGTVDIAGLAGFVCVHMIPLRKLFLYMPTPEQHYYYDELVKELLPRRADISAIYLDLACRYHKRFLALVGAMVAAGLVAQVATTVKLLLPWMHACDHPTDCQLAFSGMYTVSHAWAVLRPPDVHCVCLWGFSKRC